MWTKKVTKYKREEYISPSTGKTVAAAKPGPHCECNQRCYSKFTDEERERIFNCFWELGDKSVQDTYLHGLIHVQKVARCRSCKSDSSFSREASFVYVVSYNRLNHKEGYI